MSFWLLTEDPASQAERAGAISNHRPSRRSSSTRANLACPSFAAWLQVAAFTGLRPGELDALRWERVDFERARIVVAEQFSAATRRFDTPKNHQRRKAPLTAHARDALAGLPRESEFCFVSFARRALDAQFSCLSLEGRKGRRRMVWEPLPGHPPLRGLVHGQRA